MLTNDDKQWIRDEIRDEILSEVEPMKSDISEVKNCIQRVSLQMENDLFPLLREVASAYSASDIVFQERAASIGKMQEDALINQQMIASHENRIKELEAERNFKGLKESISNL